MIGSVPLLSLGGRDRIEATRIERVAARQPAGRQVEPPEGPVDAQRVQRVRGTGGMEAADLRQQRPQSPAVEVDGYRKEQNQCSHGNILLSLAVTASKAADSF